MLLRMTTEGDAEAITMIVGIAEAIFAGIILVFISNANKYFKNDKYKMGYQKYFDIARIAEINGKNQEAIENYNAVLYFLQNYKTDGVDSAMVKDRVSKKIIELGSPAPKFEVLVNK